MHFTLKQLRYFDAALRCGSIARAAEEMNISQSSITAAIDSIEQTSGADLFRRIPAKGIVPTETGRQIGERIAQFLEQERMFHSDLTSIAGDPAGTLRIACYAPTAPYVLPPVLKRITEEYPSIRIDLKEGDMHTINDFLNNGAVDVALTYRRSLPPTQPFMPLFRARPWALLPEASPLARKKTLRIKDLDNLPMILLDLSLAETYFRKLFQESGLALNVVHKTKSSSVLRGLVAANFGYSILNICGPNDRSANGGYLARPIKGTLDEPQFVVAYTLASERSAIVQAVINISKDLAQSGAFDHLLLKPV